MSPDIAAPQTIEAESTVTSPLPVTDDGDHERFAHIIKKSEQMKGYVMGEPVTALCGKKWIPSRDPDKYPVCPTCIEILTVLRSGES